MKKKREVVYPRSGSRQTLADCLGGRSRSKVYLRSGPRQTLASRPNKSPGGVVYLRSGSRQTLTSLPARPLSEVKYISGAAGGHLLPLRWPFLCASVSFAKGWAALLFFRLLHSRLKHTSPRPPRRSIPLIAVQPSISTIHCNYLYSLANSVLPSPMLAANPTRHSRPPVRLLCVRRSPRPGRGVTTHLKPRPALSPQLAAKSFRMRTSAKFACNTFRMNTSKNIELKVLWNEHFRKKGVGGGGPVGQLE